MSIVSTTLCYPNPASPTQGVFVHRRLAAIQRLTGVRVVAPVPWFPGLRPRRHQACPAALQTPPVTWPRMFYVPGIMKRWDASFYATSFHRAMSALREAEPVRLIDAHFVWPDGVGAWQVACDERLPFVCTIRGKLVSQIADRSKRRQIVEMLRGADALIAVSQSLADLAKEVAETELEVRVVPNGIDRLVFRRSDPDSITNVESCDVPAWSNGARYVISVGHLQALKGFHRLVEVWPEVRRRLGDVRLILVGGEAGEPEYVRRLKTQIDSVNGSAAGGVVSVALLGRQPPEKVAGLLNVADLFVLASRSEGWCNAVAEALACGCPAVVTDVGGNREIVRDLGLGRLVPLGDRDALTESICEALRCDWDRAHIADFGGRRDWQQVARECVDVFESVLT
ncbi:MAG: glycosyltransferase [Phycisphaerales bacterium]|nr:glycosyltransferase [Phycisphaerales bacterium]